METIIAATDFSKPGNGAVDYAANLARFLNCRLVIVHAFKLPLEGYGTGAPLETITEIRLNAEDKLKQIKDLLIHNSYDFGIEIYASLGTVSTIIKETTNSYGADLVVMGMTGETGKIKQHIIGSNAVKCARELSLPLLVIPEHVSYRPIQHISLAAELHNIEENTLLYQARDVAKMFNATLEIVTVEQPGDKEVAHSPEIYSFIEKKLHDTKHKQVVIYEDNKVTALEYYFKFHETDMVIVNPKKHHVFETFFSGSITRHLTFHVNVPLLILH